MTGQNAYVTYFDQRYLARALVMLGSLRKHDPGSPIFALCLDDVSLMHVRALHDSKIIALAHEEILAFEPDLRARAERPRHAFYATHKPIVPLYVLAKHPDFARVTHLDADCYVFSSMTPIFDEAPDASILLSPHRYPDEDAHWEEQYGRFNAGFISWRRDAAGLACLNDYRTQCLERVERCESLHDFMNQGYLTSWPDRFEGAHIIAHRGANLAPWNVRGHQLRSHLKDGVAHVEADNVPLIFYHFSEMYLDRDGRWRTPFLKFGEDNLAVALVRIYRPYFDAVDQCRASFARRGVLLETAPLPEGWETFHYLT